MDLIDKRDEVLRIFLEYGITENTENDLTKTDLADCAEQIVKKLIIGGVVSSFFTDSDVGNEFEIIANTSGHGFNIGEIVTLLETNADPNDDEYKFAGKDDYWWCNFADIKTK